MASSHSRQSSKRVAPPSLFVGPPTAETPAPGDQLQSPGSTLSSPQTTTDNSALTPHTSRLASGRFSSQHHQIQGISDRPRQPSTTAQSWKALQSTFEEVELNALSGASVFGAEHSRALEELRKAQVELATAWARGEAEGDGDDATAGTSGGGSHDVFGDGFAVPDRTGGGEGGEETMTTSGGRSAVLARQRDGKIGSNSGSMSSGGDGRTRKPTEKSDLERETENDILLARKRRMANDRYFERVNKGVVDVVAKLELVAQKMGGVEMESQEIWGDEAESTDGASG